MHLASPPSLLMHLMLVPPAQCVGLNFPIMIVPDLAKEGLAWSCQPNRVTGRQGYGAILQGPLGCRMGAAKCTWYQCNLLTVITDMRVCKPRHSLQERNQTIKPGITHTLIQPASATAHASSIRPSVPKCPMANQPKLAIKIKHIVKQ